LEQDIAIVNKELQDVTVVPCGAIPERAWPCGWGILAALCPLAAEKIQNYKNFIEM
jgi:hypothetical protein